MMVNNKKEMKRKGNVIRIMVGPHFLCVCMFMYICISKTGEEGKGKGWARVGSGLLGGWEGGKRKKIVAGMERYKARLLKIENREGFTERRWFDELRESEK